MLVSFAFRIVTRVLALLVMTTSLAASVGTSPTWRALYQEKSEKLNDQPSSPRLLALRDRLTAGDRTALDKFGTKLTNKVRR